MNRHHAQDPISELQNMLMVGGAVAFGAAATLAVTVGNALAYLASGETLQSNAFVVAKSFTKIPAHWSDPAAAFPAVDRARLPGPLLFWVAIALMVLAILAAVYVALMISDRMRRPSRAGGSRWATWWDIRKLRVRRASPGRLVVGRRGRSLIATARNWSLIIIGTTDSGKSASGTIPITLEHEGPALILSVKSDLLRHTEPRRNALGHVTIIDPSNSTGRATGAYTPLHRCKTWTGTLQMVDWMAGAANPKMKDGDFWQKVAQMLVRPLMFTAAISNRRMATVMRWLSEQSVEEIEAILELAMADPETSAYHRLDLAAALQTFRGVHGWDDKTVLSAYTTAATMLEAYADPHLADPTIAEAIKPLELLTGANTVYVCAPSNEQDRLRPLIGAMIEDFIAAAFEEAEEHPGAELPEQLLVMLDECANIATIKNLPTYASTCRSAGILLVSVFQDYAQIEERWGKQNAVTILNNHKMRMLITGNADVDLLQTFSKLLGDEAVREVTTSRSEGGRSSSERVAHRPLASPSQLRTLRKFSAVCVTEEHHPMKLRLRYWKSDRRMRRLAQGATK